MVILFYVFLAWWLLSFMNPIKVKTVLIPRRFSGMALAPFIFYKNMSERLWKHECEHIKQQRVFSPIIFLIMYFVEYIWNLSDGMKPFEAYYEIEFEKQAREAEFK